MVWEKVVGFDSNFSSRSKYDLEIFQKFIKFHNIRSRNRNNSWWWSRAIDKSFLLTISYFSKRWFKWFSINFWLESFLEFVNKKKHLWGSLIVRFSEALFLTEITNFHNFWIVFNWTHSINSNFPLKPYKKLSKKKLNKLNFYYFDETF